MESTPQENEPHDILVRKGHIGVVADDRLHTFQSRWMADFKKNVFLSWSAVERLQRRLVSDCETRKGLSILPKKLIPTRSLSRRVSLAFSGDQ